MRITLRLILSLIGIVTLVVFLFTSLQVQHDRTLMLEDLKKRSVVLTETIQERLSSLLPAANKKDLERALSKYTLRQPLMGLSLYDKDGRELAMTGDIDALIKQPRMLLDRVKNANEPQSEIIHSGKSKIQIYAAPIGNETEQNWTLILFQNASSIDSRVNELWKHGFMRFFILALLIALTTLFIIRWNITLPIARATDWLKKLRLGEADGDTVDLPKDIFGPLVKEVSGLAKSLNVARAAAEEEAKLRQTSESLWTPDRLRELARTKLQGKPLFVVSNREPCMHVKKGKQIDWIMPASGLVTALEPVLRACGGTWIAHGSGDADREMVDSHDRLRVPPDDPQYSLRRVWLSKEEENGYYYGFSNEGMWPLCHVAHTRPTFRVDDWAFYQSVNEKFADVVLDEMKEAEEPCVLIQDYHFALLPKMIKSKRPDARVALFWHIPWPNPESFGICPWQRQILDGMLGADLLGFHTQFHCNNFLDTVDNALESRIDWERFTVSRQDHITAVKPFPISVGFAPGAATGAIPPKPPVDKIALFKDLGVKAEFMGVGVDRIDYTKGIVERFRGIERFFEKHKEFVGRFTFVELGAPSRTLIKRYHDLMAEVEAEADRINWKFKAKEWKPIVFLEKHHSHQEIEPYYRAADVCLVTSLHDGMNLVAKEYVSARDNEDGVLILSRFTGASRELRDALLINPYDIEQTADAIYVALNMEKEERSARMKRMREHVRDHNIYRWGSNLISDLAQIRLASPQKTAV